MQLAVAGFGRILVVDRDTVELSNLNRQVIHWERDIGRKKAASAKKKLEHMNPEIEIISVEEELTDRNIAEYFADVHGVVDGLDNFPDRFVVNEFVVKNHLPFFHGAVRGFEGRATTIIPGSTPCFRCIYSEAPPKEVFPVVGVSPWNVSRNALFAVRCDWRDVLLLPPVRYFFIKDGWNQHVSV
jgi:adenylyltransferase/sulfurtransferase